MATDIEKLVVQLSADFKSLERSVSRGQSNFNRQMKAIEDRATKATKTVNASFLDLGKNFGVALGVAGSLKGFQDLVDAATRTQNALKVAGLAGDDLTDVYNKLFASAQKNAIPIESLVTLYSRVAVNQRELGVSSSQLVSFTDNVGKALRVAGVDAQSASGALLQLSQALGSGTVHAEEFNSIQEGALPILQAAAAGIKATGGSVAKLKQLVVDGKLSSQEFFQGIQAGSKILDQRLAGAATTVDQAFVRLRNSLQDAAGRINEATGASDEAVGVINRLATAVEGLSKVFTAISGGPIGSFTSKLFEIGDYIRDILPGISNIKQLSTVDLDGISGPLQNLAANFQAATGELANTENTVDVAREGLDELFKTIGEAPKSIIPDSVKADLAALKKAIDDNAVSAEDARKRFAEIGKGNPWLAEQIGVFDDFIGKMQEALAKVKEIKAELAKTTANDFKLSIPDPTGAFYDANEKRTAFLAQRDAEAARSDIDKQVDQRSKAIIDAAAKVGVALTDAAAKIQARSEIAAENLTKANSAAAGNAFDLIKGFESFRSTPYWDVNHLRAGYGSDTVTLDDGSVKEVTRGITVSVADANRDLLRRITEFQAGIRDKIGAGTFDSMTDNQQAALTSIAYNYGSLPDRIVKAIQSGDQGTVYEAIKALGADNGGINKDRRAQEAQLYLNGAPDAVTNRVTSREDFAKTLEEQRQQIAALKEETGIRASLNPLVEDYGQKLSEIQKAQELFNIAQREGTAAGKELTSAQQLLNGDLSGLSPEAQKQAEAMRALATEYGTATAASNQLQQSQEKLKQTASEVNSVARDLVGGALSDIRSAMEDGKITAKEWGQILVNVLNKIADKLQDMLLNQLFPTGGGGLLSLLGGGSSFTPTTTLGGFLGFSGAANAGQAKLPSVPSMASMPREMPRIPSPSAMRSDNRPAHVVMSVDDDGKIQQLVREQGSRTEVTVLAKSKAALDRYRSGQFHQDWEKHAGGRRVKGVPA